MPLSSIGKHGPIRWIRTEDLVGDVLAIDELHPWDQWSEARYLRTITKRNYFGMVYEDPDRDDSILGFAIYRLEEKCLYLVRIGVCSFCLRTGVGRALIDQLISELRHINRTEPNRPRLVVDVPERNIGAQLFFSACGMKARQKGQFVRFVKKV